MKLRVGFDLDGVLYNFGDSVRKFLENTNRGHLWKSGPTPAPYWDFYKDWGWTSQQFVEMCNDGADAGIIFRGGTRPNAVEAVEAVYRAGHDIIIITDRGFGTTPEVSHNATREWWDHNGFPPYAELHFSADKTCVPTDVFVEDKLANYDALMDVGTECFLINRPWNAVDGKDDRQRINDVSEYPGCVEDVAWLTSKLRDATHS